MAEFATPFDPRSPWPSANAPKPGIFDAPPAQMLPPEERFEYQPTWDQVKGLTALGADVYQMFGEEAVQRSIPERASFEAQPGVGAWNNTEAVVYDETGKVVFDAGDGPKALINDPLTGQQTFNPALDPKVRDTYFYIDQDNNIRSHNDRCPSQNPSCS
jgi:hypothetical protein